MRSCVNSIDNENAEKKSEKVLTVYPLFVEYVK